MQFLSIDESTTLSDLSQVVGSRNVDTVLSANSLTRTPYVGADFSYKCNEIVRNASLPVSTNRKIALLNTLTSDSEVYEKACLMSEDEWQIFSALNTFNSALNIPSSVSIPSSSAVIGNNQSVASSVYRQTMSQLRQNGTIDPSIFSDYSSTVTGRSTTSFGSTPVGGDIFSEFRIPWGEVQLYSSLANETIDFPCYPEEFDTARSATYGTMPETLYQYEPWYVYESSGPREQTITFKFHRDMWTGDHRDGKANELIRFCEANCYPEYNGSAVNTSIVTLYIHGTAFIRGIMTGVGTHFEGPYGLDGMPLYCELTLTITEVASSPLSYSSVRNMNIVGGYD